MLNRHEEVNGLFWWWPEDNGNKNVTNSWWNAALYNHNTGKPYAALYELKNFINGETIVGDVNNSGSVDAEDIVDAIDYILGKSQKEIKLEAIDVNNDGIANIADIVAISGIAIGN